MARWSDASKSSHQPNSPNTVNIFGHPDQSARLHRRAEAADVARLLRQGGIPEYEIFIVPDGIDDTFIADDGSQFRESRGRPLRRWSGFADQAYAIKRQRGIEYAAFADERGIDAVRQIRITAPGARIPITKFRAYQSTMSAKLHDRLRHGISWYCKNLRVDLKAVELVKIGPGQIYVHFHLVTRGGSAEELEEMRQYWVGRSGRPATGWEWWDTEADGAPEDLERKYLAPGITSEPKTIRSKSKRGRKNA